MAKRNATQRIEEGKRLIKAKAGMKHGDWLTWLKANTDVSVATAQRYMREAKAETAAPATDLNSAWQAATMEDRCKWLSEQGRMFDQLWQRVRKQDEVMARRGQAKGTYSYM